MPEIRLVTKDNWKELIRLKVADQFQGKGHGPFGKEKMLEIFHADGRIKAVGIRYEPENNAARKLYASPGFAETGEMLEGQVEAVWRLR